MRSHDFNRRAKNRLDNKIVQKRLEEDGNAPITQWWIETDEEKVTVSVVYHVDHEDRELDDPEKWPYEVQVWGRDTHYEGNYRTRGDAESAARNYMSRSFEK